MSGAYANSKYKPGIWRADTNGTGHRRLKGRGRNFAGGRYPLRKTPFIALDMGSMDSLHREEPMWVNYLSGSDGEIVETPAYGFKRMQDVARWVFRHRYADPLLIDNIELQDDIDVSRVRLWQRLINRVAYAAVYDTEASIVRIYKTYLMHAPASRYAPEHLRLSNPRAVVVERGVLSVKYFMNLSHIRPIVDELKRLKKSGQQHQQSSSRRHHGGRSSSGGMPSPSSPSSSRSDFDMHRLDI